MIRGMYDAATGLTQDILNQEVTAANLANVNTAGYRRQGYRFGTFEAALDQLAATTTPGGASTPDESGIYTNYEPGPYQSTGNPLDLAVSGDGYFVVDGPRGQLYTRNGAFQVNAGGQLETHSGLILHGEGGPIAIPPDTKQIIVTIQGRVFADNNQVGQIQIARFPNPSALRRVGDTLFEGPPPSAQQELGDVRIEQGYREQSNVDIVREMISMLAGLRHYEASQRAMRSLAEAVALNTRPGQ